jgi:hypothetical protein
VRGDNDASIPDVDGSQSTSGGERPQVAETEYTLPDAAFGFVHDLLVTDNYYVLLENPTRLDFWKLLTKYTVGQAGIAECLYMDSSRPMKVRASFQMLCLPRHINFEIQVEIYVSSIHHFSCTRDACGCYGFGDQIRAFL